MVRKRAAPTITGPTTTITHGTLTATTASVGGVRFQFTATGSGTSTNTDMTADAEL